MANRYNITRADDRWEKLTAAQNGTIDELIDMLQTHQIALMVRPTGFGKTHLMIELAKRCKYKRALYLYPIEIIRQSIFESYHTPGSEKFITNEDNEAEILKNRHGEYLPYIEFCSYDKMLEDYTNVYRLTGDTPWIKMSSVEKEQAARRWSKLTPLQQEEIRKEWIQKRIGEFDLLILDEAHRVGAEGFMKYWKYIHELTQKGPKDTRLHILGATATPLRTDKKIDIEREIFFYTYGSDIRSARIGDFGLEQCWSYGIMRRPYFIRGILDPESEKKEILAKIKEQSVKDKNILGTDIEIRDEIDRLIDIIEPVDRVITQGISVVANDTLENHGYIRLLVFHANARAMISNHEKINNAIRKALVNNRYGYKTVNPYYIVSDIEEVKQASIKISNISVLSKKDSMLKNNSALGDYEIDVIHSIDMLNMGYHVGKVTGIITCRATGSEIVYYQQIGRCISVKDNNKPLIIDLANTAAELQEKAITSQRDEVLLKIKRFIEGCDQQKYQNDAVNQFYSYCGMCLDTLPIEDAALEFWYFDRHAPIYYIYSISRSLGKKETLESIIRRIYNLCNKRKLDITLDSDYCTNIPGIHGSIKAKLIEPQPEKLKQIRKKIRL